MGNKVEKFLRCTAFDSAEAKDRNGKLYFPDSENEWNEQTVGQCLTRIETWETQTVAEQLDNYSCKTEEKDLSTWRYKIDEFTVTCTGVLKTKTAPTTK